MVVARSPKAIIVAHPLRVSFVHIVVLPVERPTSPKEISDFYMLATDIAQSFVERHSTKANVERFLEKFSHVGPSLLSDDDRALVRPEVSQSRPNGADFEIADFMSTFASSDTVPFAQGVFLTPSEFASCQMHILSEDFRYVGSCGRFLWNIFHSKYFLRYQKGSSDAFIKALATSKVTIEEVEPILRVLPAKCPVCSIGIESLDALRNHYLVSHTGDTIAEKQTTQAVIEPKRDAPAVARAKRFLERKKTQRQSDLPEKPKQTECANDINAVTSLLMKWSSYYFSLHLLRDNLQDATEDDPKLLDVKEGIHQASKVLEKLQAMDCVEQAHRRRFLHIQRRIRNAIYGIEEKVLKIA